MKISCQSCQAKYTIADEKVLGKIVKIRCKKCGATIVINGNETAASGGAASASATSAPADENVFDYTAQATGGEQWTVNVADGDQRTMSTQEIVSEFKASVVNEETFCWKDGMSDWLPLREIDELYSLCTMGPTPSLSPDQTHQEAFDQPPMSARAPQSNKPEAGGFLFGGAGNSIPVTGPSAPPPNGNGAGLFGGAVGSTTAARRQGGRGGADLFGGVAQAGGEEDVMTSAPAGMPQASTDPGKLTGQRNENSVLFSLNALTQTEAKSEAPPPVGEGSGLIDIRALSANMGSNEKAKTSHVDDIMNLGGGGAFSAALAAPVLAPPAMDASSADIGGSGGKANKTVLLGLIGGGAFIALSLVLIFVLRKPAEPPPVATGPTTAPTETAAPVDTGAPAVAPVDSAAAAAPGAMAAAPGTGPAAQPKSPGGGGGGGGGGAAPKPVAKNDSPAAPAAVPPSAPAAPAKPTSFADAIKSAAGDTGGGAPAAAPAGGTAPFDRGAAAAALAAVNVTSCKKPDGPTGSGHVKVTFAPNGTVSSAVVDQPPFAGTPVGGCVAGKFRGAHIPAFAGSPQPVGKSFIIN